jgi:cysteine-rich repeat protein
MISTAVRPARWGALFVVLALPIVIVGEATAACEGGRFLVEGDPVIEGGVAGQDGLTIADQVSLDSGCLPTSKFTMRHRRAGTKVTARWSSCAGILGKARLRATIDSACESVRGTFVARRLGIRRSVRATLSTCGDTILDPGNGEQCEVGTDCVAGACVQCQCDAPTTTSVTTTVTTTTGTLPTSTTSTTIAATTTTETTTTDTTSTSTTTTTSTSTTTTTTTSTTTTTTTIPVCSDGVVNGTEVCDDGDLEDGDGCDSNCTPTACGNGIVTFGEECDDGNTDDLDGCDSSCVVECGNGTLDPDEHCDDGNATDGDGCESDCTVTVPELLYYAFDGSGTSVPNLASAPPAGTTTATLQGGLTQGGTEGVCGGGSVIGTGNASSTDYVNTGWAPDRGTGAWTISFRTKNIGPSATLYYIFGDANSASFRCFTNGVAGANNWIIRGAGLTDTYVNGGAVVAPTMTTFVYDPTQNHVRGYLNGVLVTTVAQTAPNLTGTGPLKVVGYSTNVGMPANGYLDEFRVYNRALTDQDVANLYAWTNTCPTTTTTTTSSTTTTLPAHCENLIVDGDETGIDCGGSCPPCGP